MNHKTIKALRTFFKLSTAAFEMQQKIVEAFGGIPTTSHMHRLHQLAKLEIEKEQPNLGIIDDLLAEMEEEAERLKSNS